MSINPRRRESPPQAGSIKTTAAEDGAKATEVKTAGRDPRQEIARQPQERDSQYATRRHKSIFEGSLSPRLDSREQIYSAMDAWAGQSHE